MPVPHAPFRPNREEVICMPFFVALVSLAVFFGMSGLTVLALLIVARMVYVAMQRRRARRQGQ